MIVRSEEIVKQAASWQAAGQKVAFATVVKTWGSSPRPVGSQLVINDDRKFAGSVSGGCIEGAVVGEAAKVIGGEPPKTLKFNVTDGEAMNIGLTCGGSVSVYISALNPGGILPELNIQLLKRTPLSTVTKLSTGQRNLITGDQVSGPLTLPDTLVTAARDAFTNRTCTTLHDDGGDGDGEEYFIHSYPPAPRIFIVGAGHISQALVPMASTAGFDVTVIDPRTAFITTERFPETELAPVWPDEFLRDNKPDSSTAVVTLVHDPKIDDPALEIAIRSDAFYVGALGSRGTHSKRVERFTTNNYSADELARIKAPIGLDLGGRKPAEIAVSILAEIIQVWTGRSDKAP